MLWDLLTVNEMKGDHRGILATASDLLYMPSGLRINYVPCALRGADGEVQLSKLAV